MPADVIDPESLHDDRARRAACAELLARHSEKQLLRLLTCGSVDDGKSTLIGRLLLEAGAVYDDQLAHLRQESLKHGTTGGEIDAALLVDGLEDERQQGITIDVAYRYFTTSKRKFIIADTPGHEQFTRNMATGASNSDLAVIVLDARKGVLTQTRRHAFIVSLMGIKHVVLAVNKMDLVDYSQTVFEQIRNDFCRLSEHLEIPDIRFVPVSALRGDNVAEPSANTLWYADGSLLHLLESIYVAPEQGARQLRFPVQWVNRPDANFRGFSGTLAAGRIRVFDEVLALPSRKRTRVRGIVTMDGPLVEAEAPAAVTLTLEDEIDLTRGDLLVRPDEAPPVLHEAEATLVWMSEKPLTPGKPYWCKHATKRTVGEVQRIRYAIDVNTQQHAPAEALRLNEIGVVRIAFRDPLPIDPFATHRVTGSFVLVDRITHETVAAGMFRASDAQPAAVDHWDVAPASRRLEYAASRISPEVRRRRYGHRPGSVLVTGLSGVGKTSAVLELERLLFERGCVAVVLDGQNLRFGVSRDLGFSAAERSENLRRAAEIAKLVNDAGQLCLAALVAPEAAVRRRVRELIGPERFVHVHLTAPLDVCRARDASGRYAAADQGEISSFPGVTFPYESPEDADRVLSTVELGPTAVAQSIVELLEERGMLVHRA